MLPWLQADLSRDTLNVSSSIFGATALLFGIQLLLYHVLFLAAVIQCTSDFALLASLSSLHTRQHRWTLQDNVLQKFYNCLATNAKPASARDPKRHRCFPCLSTALCGACESETRRNIVKRTGKKFMFFNIEAYMVVMLVGELPQVLFSHSVQWRCAPTDMSPSHWAISRYQKVFAWALRVGCLSSMKSRESLSWKTISAINSINNVSSTQLLLQRW